MEKVSIIIPIYNIEDYIKDCLESVINQTYKNLEIICVDDCGTDSSMKIVEDYAKNDNRIKIVKQRENRGQGEARNLGIVNSATGKYIYFIDSDDFIGTNYIKELVDIAESENVDLVCNINILKFYSKDNIKNKFIKNKNDFILNKKLDWDESFMKKLPISAWCKLYKTDIIKEHEIYFADNKLKFEDFYFWYILKTRIKSIYIIFGSTYFYRQRINSTMSLNKYRKNDCFDSIHIINLIYLYYKNNGLLGKHAVPFSWLNKYFKKINNKKEFFATIKKYFQEMKHDILENKKIYKKRDMAFFNSILNSNNYIWFKIRYIFCRMCRCI